MSKGPTRRGSGMSRGWAKGGDTRWQKFRLWIMGQWKLQGRDECEIKGKKCTIIVEQVDHITPLAMGGEKYDPLNCRPSCATCNTGRRNADSEYEPQHKTVSTW